MTRFACNFSIVSQRSITTHFEATRQLRKLKLEIIFQQLSNNVSQTGTHGRESRKDITIRRGCDKVNKKVFIINEKVFIVRNLFFLSLVNLPSTRHGQL